MRTIKLEKPLEKVKYVFWIEGTLVVEQLCPKNMVALSFFKCATKLNISDAIYRFGNFGKVDGVPAMCFSDLYLRSILPDRILRGSCFSPPRIRRYFRIHENDLLLPFLQEMKPFDGVNFVQYNQCRISQSCSRVAAMGLEDTYEDEGSYNREHAIDFFPPRISEVVRKFDHSEFMIIDLNKMEPTVYSIDEEILGVSINSEATVVAVVCRQCIVFLDLE